MFFNLQEWNPEFVFNSGKSGDTFGWSILELSYTVNIYCQDWDDLFLYLHTV